LIKEINDVAYECIRNEHDGLHYNRSNDSKDNLLELEINDEEASYSESPRNIIDPPRDIEIEDNFQTVAINKR